MVFTDYTGLTVAEMAQLRKHLGKGLQYKVIKNTIAMKASKGTPIAVAHQHFKGQVGIAIGYEDAVGTVKKVIEFSKKNEKLRLGIGVIEGRLCTKEDLKRMAELPPRHVLLGMLAGVMQAPLSKMLTGLSASVNSFGNAMNALMESRTPAK